MLVRAVQHSNSGTTVRHEVESRRNDGAELATAVVPVAVRPRDVVPRGEKGREERAGSDEAGSGLLRDMFDSRGELTGDGRGREETQHDDGVTARMSQ